MSKPLTFLCMASYFKGTDLLYELKALGCNVILLAREAIRDKWPREPVDEIFGMPDLWNREHVFNGVSYLARTREIDRIIAIDDYDVETAAALREHLRIPGMGDTTARHFRDKLAMRVQARDHGIPVPRFEHVLNFARLQRYLDQVPGPWVIKPRSEAGAVGIKKCQTQEEVWQHVHSLGDKQSYQLIEQFLPGDVFHVDSIVWEREVVFAVAQRYRTPPFRLWNEGGVFVTRTVPRGVEPHDELMELNRKVLEAMRMVRGATHAEYIMDGSGRLHFLELAARVGGAHVHDMVDAATGVNLWKEWARLEVAHARGEEYRVPDHRKDCAALMICLAQDEWPDTSAYDDPEVVWRMSKDHHAGLIVASPEHGRVEHLVDAYTHRFEHDFLAVAPPAASHLDYE